MDERKLRTLLTVLSAGSLNSAAERLSCTQSAVTQMMNSIENELGFAVFTRTNKGVALTEEGDRILPYITAADAALSELAEEAGRIAKGDGTKLIVGTFSSISATWLQKLESSAEVMLPFPFPAMVRSPPNACL